MAWGNRKTEQFDLAATDNTKKRGSSEDRSAPLWHPMIEMSHISIIGLLAFFGETLFFHLVLMQASEPAFAWASPL